MWENLESVEFFCFLPHTFQIWWQPKWNPPFPSFLLLLFFFLSFIECFSLVLLIFFWHEENYTSLLKVIKEDLNKQRYPRSMTRSFSIRVFGFKRRKVQSVVGRIVLYHQTLESWVLITGNVPADSLAVVVRNAGRPLQRKSSNRGHWYIELQWWEDERGNTNACRILN